MFFCFQSCYATKIVAIVGDSAITDYELSQKTKIIAMLQNVDIKKANFSDAELEILPMVIDDEIKKIYIQQLKIKISKDQVDSFLLTYGKKVGKKTIKDIENLVRSKGIDVSLFRETIAGEIAWSQIVYNGLARSVNISENEIIQRARIMNTDISDQQNLYAVKNILMEEKLALNIQKILSQVKKTRIVEKFQ